MTQQSDPTIRLDYYESFSSLTLPIADSMGVTISDETVATQTIGWRVAALVDSIVDAAPEVTPTRLATLDYLQRRFIDGEHCEPTGVPEDLVASAEKLHDRITPSQAALFVQIGIASIRLTDQIRTVENPREYAVLTLEEGQYAGQMFHSLLNDTEQQQAGYERYATFMERMTGAANLVDSIFDLPKDYCEGLTRIKPTLPNFGKLVRVALPETASCLREVGLQNTVSMTWSTVRAVGRAVQKKMAKC